MSVYRTAPEYDELIARLRTHVTSANPVATPDEIVALEACIGHELPRLLVRLYTEIGNGGFGPPYGLLPLSEVGKLWELWVDVDEPGYEAWRYPRTYLLIVDAGCAMYYCVDIADPEMCVWLFEPGSFIADDEELYDEEDELEPTSAEDFMDAVFQRERPLVAFLERWLDGKG